MTHYSWLPALKSLPQQLWRAAETQKLQFKLSRNCLRVNLPWLLPRMPPRQVDWTPLRNILYSEGLGKKSVKGRARRGKKGAMNLLAQFMICRLCICSWHSTWQCLFWVFCAYKYDDFIHTLCLRSYYFCLSRGKHSQTLSLFLPGPPSLFLRYTPSLLYTHTHMQTHASLQQHS